MDKEMDEDTENCAVRDLIRNILLKEWDPIGIITIGGPDYEYDRYIDGILDILRKGGDAEANIREHLKFIHTQRMRLANTKLSEVRRERAAKALHAIKI